MKITNNYRDLIEEKINPIFNRIMVEAEIEARKAMNTSGEIDRETSKRIFEKATGSIVKDIIYGLGIENIQVRAFNPSLELFYENIEFWLFFNKAAVKTKDRITRKQHISNLMSKINCLYYCFTENATEINYLLNKNENNEEDLSEDYEPVDVDDNTSYPSEDDIRRLEKICLIIDILKDETESLDISLNNSRKLRNHLLELFKVYRITLDEWRDTMRYLSSYWLQEMKYDNRKGV